MIRIRDRRNFACAGVFVGLAAVLAFSATRLTVGTAASMGPGYLPLALALILGALGIALGFRSLRVDGPPSIVEFEWRGFSLVTLAIVVFAATITRLGFVPAVALTSAIATMASRRMRVRTAVVVTVVLLVFCWLVFVRGLGLPVRMFGA